MCTHGFTTTQDNGIYCELCTRKLKHKNAHPCRDCAGFLPAHIAPLGTCQFRDGQRVLATQHMYYRVQDATCFVAKKERP